MALDILDGKADGLEAEPTVHIIYRSGQNLPFFPEKCGFIDTGKDVLCPNLEVGSDKPVRVMRLDYAL